MSTTNDGGPIMPDTASMPARIWITAEDRSASWAGSFTRWHASDLDYGDEYPVYHRADIVERLAEALKECQSALAALTTPEAIKETNVASAWANCVAAEAKARSALKSYREASNDHVA